MSTGPIQVAICSVPAFEKVKPYPSEEQVPIQKVLLSYLQGQRPSTWSRSARLRSGEAVTSLSGLQW